MLNKHRQIVQAMLQARANGKIDTVVDLLNIISLGYDDNGAPFHEMMQLTEYAREVLEAGNLPAMRAMITKYDLIVVL